MGSTKYYKMLDAYLDFYTDYVNTSTDLMCASVMLDANDLPVLILVSKPDDDGVSTFSFYGFEKNKVIFISNCNSYLTYLCGVYTDGIVRLNNDSSVWYQIKDNQMYKIEDDGCCYMDGEKIAEVHYNEDYEATCSYYIDGKRIDVTDDTYDSYSEEIENLWVDYYTSVCGEDLINSYLEWRSAAWLDRFLSEPADLYVTLFWFSDLYESGYGNNYIDFQMLISKLKEMTDVNQKEFYFTTVNYLVENGYIDYNIYDTVENAILNRDTSWMPDLLEAWGKWEDYEYIVEHTCSLFDEDQTVPVPNLDYTAEQVCGADGTATKNDVYSDVNLTASVVTDAKIAELEAQYGISYDVVYGIIDWWHSDEYISAIDTALETRLEYLDAVSADSSLIGYWECGDEMLKIYYSEDEGGLVIDADIAEKTGISAGKYCCYDEYSYWEDDSWGRSWHIEKGVEYVSIGFCCESTNWDDYVYFDMILTCVDDNTLEIKFIPEGEWYSYDSETGEEVEVDASVTSTFTRMNLTDEEIAQIEFEEELEAAKEIYLEYWNNAPLTGEFVFSDLTGDGIPEIIYNAVGYGETAILYIDDDGAVQENLECNVRMINIEEGTFYCAWYNAYYTDINIITYDEMDAREVEHTFLADVRDNVDWDLYDDEEYYNPYNANIYQYHTDDVEYATYDEAYEVFESYCGEYNLILTEDVDWFAEETFQEELEAYGN